MNRRHFIKQTTISSLVLVTIPSFALTNNLITSEELIGNRTPKLFGDSYKLRKEAHDAFLLMKAEALKEQISIEIISSYRNFEHQKRIWTKKYKRYIN